MLHEDLYEDTCTLIPLRTLTLEIYIYDLI